MDAGGVILLCVLAVPVLIGVFVLGRRLALWYFRINEVIATLGATRAATEEMKTEPPKSSPRYASGSLSGPAVSDTCSACACSRGLTGARVARSEADRAAAGDGLLRSPGLARGAYATHVRLDELLHHVLERGLLGVG